jgi:hypothetical protein
MDIGQEAHLAHKRTFMDFLDQDVRITSRFICCLFSFSFLPVSLLDFSSSSRAFSEPDVPDVWLHMISEVPQVSWISENSGHILFGEWIKLFVFWPSAKCVRFHEFFIQQINQTVLCSTWFIPPNSLQFSSFIPWFFDFS